MQAPPVQRNASVSVEPLHDRLLAHDAGRILATGAAAVAGAVHAAARAPFVGAIVARIGADIRDRAGADVAGKRAGMAGARAILLAADAVEAVAAGAITADRAGRTDRAQLLIAAGVGRRIHAGRPSVPFAPPLPDTTTRSTRASEPVLPAPPSNCSGDDDPQESPPPALSTSATTAQTPRRDRLGTASDMSRPREAKPSDRRENSTHAQRAMKVQPVNEQCVGLIADIHLAFRHCSARGRSAPRPPTFADARQNFDGSGLARPIALISVAMRVSWLNAAPTDGSIGAVRPTARARKFNHSPARIQLRRMTKLGKAQGNRKSGSRGRVTNVPASRASAAALVRGRRSVRRRCWIGHVELVDVDGALVIERSHALEQIDMTYDAPALASRRRKPDRQRHANRW